MIGRLVRVSLAAAAALLLAQSVTTVRAERAYEAGLDRATDPQTDPAADVPGRLADYEEAMRLDPGESRYALRAGQIRLYRALRGTGTNPGGELDGARERLATAARLRPLDWMVRATIARLHVAEHDPTGAAFEAELAVRLAPRAPGALGTAIGIGLWAWEETRDPAPLATALRAGAGMERIGQPLGERGAGAMFRTAFERAGRDLAGDLLAATVDDAELRDYAARAVRPVRPSVADALSVWNRPDTLPR